MMGENGWRGISVENKEMLNINEIMNKLNKELTVRWKNEKIRSSDNESKLKLILIIDSLGARDAEPKRINDVQIQIHKIVVSIALNNYESSIKKGMVEDSYEVNFDDINDLIEKLRALDLIKYIRNEMGHIEAIELTELGKTIYKNWKSDF